MLADGLFKDWLESTGTKPSPAQTSLDALWAMTKSVTVSSGAFHGRALLGRLTDGEVGELAALIAIIEPSDRPAAHCMTLGDYVIEAFDGDDNKLATIELILPNTIRWSAWNGDTSLVDDGGPIAGWLTARGMTGPLTKYRSRAGA